MAIIDTVRFDKTEPIVFNKMDSWGFVRARVSLARPGIYIYETKDGRKIRELVPREVLTDRAVIDSIAGTPITVDHPAERVVTPKTAEKYMVGSSIRGDYDHDRDHQVADVCLTHQRAQEAIEAGKNMFSPCYPVRIDDTPGVDPEFGPYDTKQVERGPYNHNALTDNPRGGVDMTIHNDSAGVQTMFVRTDSDEGNNNPDPIMAKLDAMDTKLDSQNQRFDGIEKRLDALEGKKAGQTPPVPPTPPAAAEPKMDSFVDQYNERTELMAAYKRLKQQPNDKHTNAQLKRVLVEKMYQSVNSDSSDEVVDSFWAELQKSIEFKQPMRNNNPNGQFGMSLLSADSNIAEQRRGGRIKASELKKTN